MEKSTLERIVDIVVDKLGVEAKEVVPSANFSNDLSADSLDRVELVMEFEKEFKIVIPDEEAEKINTVGDAVAYFETHFKK